MKNSIKVLSIALLVLSCISLQAQKIGFKAGYNYSNPDIIYFFWEDAAGTSSGASGFHIGPYVDLELAKILSMEIGVQFESKPYAYQYSSALENVYATGQAQVYYLEIPVLMKLGFDMSSTTRVYGVMGSYLAIGIGGKDEGTFIRSGEETTYSNSYWSSSGYYGIGAPLGIFEKMDIGLVFGAGVEIENVQVSASYEIGFGEVGANFDRIDVYNRVFKVSLGYSFPVRKG